MSATVQELIEWLQTIAPDAQVGIDEGGLTLIVDDVDADEKSSVYFELGGLTGGTQ